MRIRSIFEEHFWTVESYRCPKCGYYLEDAETLWVLDPDVNRYFHVDKTCPECEDVDMDLIPQR